ncbi:2-octaprenyl-6-methoxyphenyl hydroxylase [Alteromonas sp. 5E99-2]|uniref:2-octaprenyl-6-methoxyphenyl hydroxylase n=1 Tax=Alteromonas sp. 5E99-2 TaxID=2817683 RepID=UPI001A990DEF|nr:2-octaprenyl-6-methoxyphenyl hydroxylase [Alteromonas sp. 5E99-2]
MSAEITTDIVIVGGGATGLSLALGLAKKTGLSALVVDQGAEPDPNATHPQFDQRTIALSLSSIDILAGFDIGLDTLTHSPIEHIHVSDQHHAGQVRLSADEQSKPAFGYVVSLAALGSRLYGALQNLSSSQIQYRSSTQVTALKRHSSSSELALSDGTKVNASLVVLADGGRSPFAESIGFYREDTDYQQTALTFVASTTEPHQGKAYERFTDKGPLALLPLGERKFGVAWTVQSTQAEYLLNASKAKFIQHFQDALGYRQGVVTDFSEVVSYPLVLRQLTSTFIQGTVAIGNAAQTLHPIAGQGANLGFRDVNTLVNVLAESTQDQLGDYQTLSKYSKQRETDRQATIQLSDSLVRVFSNGYEALQIGRNVALSMMNLSPVAKREFALQAMGYKNATF